MIQTDILDFQFFSLHKLLMSFLESDAPDPSPGNVSVHLSVTINPIDYSNNYDGAMFMIAAKD